MSKLAHALRALVLVSACVASTVHAQATPTTLTAAPAKDGAPPPPAALEKITLDGPKYDQQITANISAGATLNSGNTKSYAFTGGGRFQLIRKPHQLTIEALGTYTRAEIDEGMHPTAGNIIGRARYDIFLSKNDALFVALQPRHDKFAGLDLRLQTQAGYLRNLYNPGANHRLWTEVGYDGTYDNFSLWLPHGVERPDNQQKGDQFIHSARLFAGYTNMLTPLASLNVGLELLLDLQNSNNTRVNSLIELTSSLNSRFKLSLLSRILYDHEPITGKDKADFITTAQIVFTYDSIKPAATCPECDCTSKVAAATAACPQNVTVSPADAPAPSTAIPVEPSAAPTSAQPAQPAPAAPPPAKPTP